MPRTAVFTVTLSQPSDEQVTIDYVTVDITATSPDDYTAKRGTLVFAAGETIKTISIDVREPMPGLPEKRFVTTLYRPVNCSIADPDGSAAIPAGPTANLGGPLIVDGLMTNAFHDNNAYFFHTTGTSEGQAIGIEGSLLAYQVLADGNPEERDAANWYRANGQVMLDALGNGTYTGPILRQPEPTNVKTITLPNWLFAARGDIPYQAINYTFQATSNGNTLMIPANVPGHRGAMDVYRIYQIYPATSHLLYPGEPDSPSYNTAAPAADTSIKISSADWVLSGSTVVITMPAAAPPEITEWCIVYAYRNAGVIPQGEGVKGFPCWSPIAPGYATAAPDTFRWFEHALTLAMEADNRTGMPARWMNLRNVLRRTSVSGRAISDTREIIKPMPQYDPIPISGEPEGMYCTSTHPQALPPTAGEISAGADPSWTGYNFWQRVGGSNRPVEPGEFTWTPDNMLEEVNNRNFFNGALSAAVPVSPTLSQVTIGRIIADSWRVLDTYQDPDQFMFVALSLSRRPDAAAGEHCYVVLSPTRAINPATCWYADIGQSAELVPEETPGKPSYVLIPRTAFLRIHGDNIELPAGQLIENFSIQLDMQAAYTVQLVAMRLVSGASEDAVRQNMVAAARGAPMPFTPGVAPYAISANITRQQYVGWNRSPFHGYQLPDLWCFLKEDADAVLPGLDPAVNMPVVNAATGAIEYPIISDAGGVAKPKHALLAEQQLLFLKQAQDRWVTDGGESGPFAQAFVMNTPARVSYGSPYPHTWVYGSDAPNSKAVTYQCRVVESMARLAFLSRTSPEWATARQLATSMAVTWIARINALWPNLNGVVVGEETIFGMPTDFVDPRTGPPQTQGEDPQAAAVLLRACMWLKLSGLLTADQLNIIQAVGKRCWDYLEIRYHKEPLDTMRYTWANSLSDIDQYYGFWHFEIIATFAYLLKFPDGMPSGISAALLRQRLVETQTWLHTNVR